MSSSQSDDPIGFYFLASWLNAHRQDPLIPEVSRVIVGRAYYAAFLAARDQANQSGTGARIHNDVISHYRAKDSFVSNKLADLKRLREQADYDLNNSVLTSDIDTSLKGCKAILKKLKLLNCSAHYPEGYSPLNLE
jgi:uncharacterized protein (UPF0332 family)